MSIKISDHFDGGAIVVKRAAAADDIELEIRKDNLADFAQWFYFRVQGVRDQQCVLRFTNVAASAYPDGWEGYRAVASYDRKTWFRVPTEFDGQVMTIRHQAEADSVYYAYFEPYTWDRHLDTIARWQLHPAVRVADIGTTLDGRDMNLLTIGDTKAAHKIWMIARQHPGETMAEWFVEGFVDALLDETNPVSRALLDQCVFYIVPNMNPDGSVRGNLRTNAAGANLNREWMTPSLERSPEVLCVRQQLHDIGCDMFFDIHGDEGLPYNFVAGSEVVEGVSADVLAHQARFIASFKEASPDFQDTFGYPPSKYNAEMLTLASKYVAHTMGCLSLTLEMPFKDNADLPDPIRGWDGARSARLGASMLLPILRNLPGKRGA